MPLPFNISFKTPLELHHKLMADPTMKISADQLNKQSIDNLFSENNNKWIFVHKTTLRCHSRLISFFKSPLEVHHKLMADPTINFSADQLCKVVVVVGATTVGVYAAYKIINYVETYLPNKIARIQTEEEARLARMSDSDAW